ncbi:F-box/LRR-repeat protein 12 [Acorus calamus]|uniref:F-box/LRR-repeat protein 12 n=1 Tax=Acorus calamus TaxID=4465 RepID=A0AAV9CFU9_ACOCL|nr:F-box/LRR-repeat protein 12 [Acorus calamus]
MASINDLTDDILLVIFRNLSCSVEHHKFGLTCHRWLRLQNIARRSLSLEFSYDTHVYHQYIRYLPRLVSRFPNLRSNVTDVGIKALAKSCPGLESVNLSLCTLISDAGIGALSRGCPGIRAMVLSSCPGVTGTGFHGCSSSLVFVQANCSSLTPEGILGVASGGGLEPAWVGSDGLEGLGGGLARNLRFLNLHMCMFIGDQSVSAISRGCPNLEEWKLAACHEVRAPVWVAIGSNCMNLKVLHVNRCGNLCDSGLRSIREGCARLARLYMHGCRMVTADGLELFRKRRPEVQVMREEFCCFGPSLDEYFLR